MDRHRYPQPPPRSGTLSVLFRAVTGNKGKGTEVERSPVFITKYGLKWEDLKGWLDSRFATYGRTFTERFEVVRLDHQAKANAQQADSICSRKMSTLFTYLNSLQGYLIP